MSILCYHAVDPSWRSPLAVPPAVFEAHCSWLARTRTVVPLEVAVARMDHRGRLPRGVVALTFDDGFAQLNEYVFPVLARYALPATVFLVVATLTPAGHPVDWVDTPPDWVLETLSLEQVAQARLAGVTFSSHSWAHRTLTALDEEDCRKDLTLSRDVLSDYVHAPVNYLAYPRGKHNAIVRRAAAAAGYSRAFALPENTEIVGPHSLPRVGIFPGDGIASLRVKTDPAYLRVRHSPIFPVLRSMARGRA